MNKTEFLQILTSGHDRMVGLTRSKGEEYSSSDDQLGNFRRLAEQTGLTMPQVWLVLFTKHLDAIRTWIKDEATGTKRERSEPIEGRIEDAILYLYLLRAVVEDGKPLEPSEEYRSAMARALNPPPIATEIVAEMGAPYVHTVYCGSDQPIPDARAAELIRPHFRFERLQPLTHAAYLHGAKPGNAVFVWIGPMGTRGEEFKDKAERLGMGFVRIPGFEYADDKFGG